MDDWRRTPSKSSLSLGGNLYTLHLKMVQNCVCSSFRPSNQFTQSLLAFTVTVSFSLWRVICNFLNTPDLHASMRDFPSRLFPLPHTKANKRNQFDILSSAPSRRGPLFSTANVGEPLLVASSSGLMPPLFRRVAKRKFRVTLYDNEATAADDGDGAGGGSVMGAIRHALAFSAVLVSLNVCTLGSWAFASS